jgi:recombination associated protein RdgC
MWFRNLRPYRLPNRLGIDADTLSTRMADKPFVPCRPTQPYSTGWLPALDDSASDLVHAAGPFWLIRLNREEKLLPASVIRDEVNARVSQIATAQGRKVYRKEKLEITDEVTQDLMPRAFSRSRPIEALIHEREGWLWVNQASAPRAEDLLNALREVIGTLPAELPRTRKSPAQVMTDWLLHGGVPEGFELGEDADLEDPREGGGVVRARGVALDSDDIRAHLEGGMVVSRLALDWQERLSFVLDKDLVIRRLKFADELVQTHEDLAEDRLAQRDADFLLMGENVAELQAELVRHFGGLEV